MERTVLVGGGKMGEALASGLLAAGHDSLVIVEASAERRGELEGRFTVEATVEAAAARGAFSAVIAVKPQHVEHVCDELAPAGVRRVLSIAAGLTLDSLAQWLPDVPVLRAMPNTPALVGSAASAFSAGPGCGREDRDWAQEVLSAVGTVVELPESSLDAVTGLSGSGPAYVFLVAEALIDGGVAAGLPRPVAAGLAVQTLLGSARMLAETGEEPSSLRAAVTSPGGTTAAALRVLEAAAVRAALIDAVAASAGRARELGLPPA